MSINSDETVVIGEEDSVDELSDSQGNGQTEVDGGNRELGELPSYIKEFDMEIGRARVNVDQTGESMMMWKAKASSGEECVSNTMFDAVMGCIEKVSGGEI